MAPRPEHFLTRFLLLVDSSTMGMGQSTSYSTRRQFLRTAGLGTLGVFGVTPNILSALQPMRVDRVDVVTFSDNLKIGGGSGGADGAEFIWIRIHTEDGHVGYGETYPFSSAERGALQRLAKQIVGQDPRDLDKFWEESFHQQAMRNTGGAEIRALSAFNMAQLDLLGKSAGLPAYRLLGGRTRERVRVYNTTTNYWAINGMQMGTDTRKIVRFLLDRGITAMKIYPFRGEGEYISPEEIQRGIDWIRQIKDEAGNQMEICVDCWGRWDYVSAQKITEALEPFNILYLEDVMLPSSVDTYARLAEETNVPICMSETLATRYEYREVLEAGACDVVMFDCSWVGGPVEGKKVADLTESYRIPVSPHTAGGPLLWLSSIHLSTALPNLLIMESNYWKYAHQYPYFLSEVPTPEDGMVAPPERPGLGAEVRPGLFDRGEATVSTVAEI